MKKESKVVSLLVKFADEMDTTYAMVATEDIEVAKKIAQEWAEMKVGKQAVEVVMNKGVIDIPEMEPTDEFKGYSVWELAF